MYLLVSVWCLINYVQEQFYHLILRYTFLHRDVLIIYSRRNEEQIKFRESLYYSSRHLPYTSLI
jgi:hypothetical protein